MPGEPWIQRIVDAAARTPPDVLYHYTGIHGLHGILTNRSLHATQVGYTTDRGEFEHGLDRIRALCKERVPATFGSADAVQLERLLPRDQALFGRPWHLISFSADGNSLSQWRAYGGPQGTFALGFRAAELKALFGGDLLPCIYDADGRDRVLEAVWAGFETLVRRDVRPDGRVHDTEMMDLVLSLGEMYALAAAMHKEPAFDVEREWRLLLHEVRPMPDPLAERHKRTKVAGASVVPFLDVRLAPQRQLPLASVTVGPTAPDPARAEDSVRALLNVHGPANTTVGRSGIPYRGRG